MELFISTWPWDNKNILVKFQFLISAIFLQEKTKIIPFPVSWQTGNGIINFNMSPGTSQICLSTSNFSSQLFSFRKRQKNHFLFPGKQEMKVFISICPLGIKKYACQLSFSFCSYFTAGIGKIISFSVSWQTGNGIIDFNMYSGTTQIWLSASIFLSRLFSFRNRQK